MVDEVEEISGKTIQTLPLLFTPSYHGAVSWSGDDRISIVTEQCVYVITLFYSDKNVKSKLSFHLTSVPVRDTCFHFAADDGLNNHDYSQNSHDKVVMDRIADHAANPSKQSGVNYTAFKSVAWSPVECEGNGRCILATLCLDHRLSLYVPSNTSNSWKEVACISDRWHDNCKEEILPDVQKAMKKIRTNSGVHMPEAKISHMAATELEYIDNVAFTCLDWCPVLLDLPGNDKVTKYPKYVLLATVRRCGKVMFWAVAAPIVCQEPASIEMLEGEVDTGVQSPCSVAWYSKNGANGWLAVGSPEGQIWVFSIEVTRNSESKLTIDSTSKHALWADIDEIAVNWTCWVTNDNSQAPSLVACKGSAVITFTLPSNEGESLQEARHQVYDGAHLSFISGLSVCQNSRVFTCGVDGSLQMINTNSGDVAAITRDAKPFYSPIGLAVSPNGLYVAILDTPSIDRLQNRAKYRQIVVNIVSLVTEKTLSRAILGETPSGTSWDIKTAISQYYSQNGPPQNGPILQILDKPLENVPLSALYIRRRLEERLGDCSGTGRSESELSVARDWKSKARETGRQIVKVSMSSLLKSRLEMSEEYEWTTEDRLSLLIMSDWLVMNYSDADTLGHAVQVYSVTHDTDSARHAVSIRTLLQGMLGGTKDHDPLRPEVYQSSVVIETPSIDGPPTKQQKNERQTQNGSVLSTGSKNQSDTPTLPCREKCAICESDVPLTNLVSGQCTDGHAWKRCLVSFCICADYSYLRCQDCGGCVAMTTDDTSPWLRDVLQGTNACPLCDGLLNSRS